MAKAEEKGKRAKLEELERLRAARGAEVAEAGLTRRREAARGVTRANPPSSRVCDRESRCKIRCLQEMVRIRFLLGAALFASLTGAFGCSTFVLRSNLPERTRPPEDAMWISPAEVKRLPMRGPAWEQAKAAASGPLGSANVADQDSHHDVNTLAAALVYVRTGDPNYRKEAADAISSAIGTEQGGPVLALARNLLSYVIAAQLIDLKEYDPAGERRFRTWLEEVRSEPLGSDPVGSQNLVELHERGASNGGGMAGASRVAVAVYLRDEKDIARAAQVMKGWLGDRSAYPGIPAPDFGPEDEGKGLRFGGYNDDLSWQTDPSKPVGVDPKGAVKDGHSIDGALPDDMRRGGPFRWPPEYTQYPREALSGYVAMAELLHRQGYDVYDWSDRALLRATRFLWRLNREFPGEGWWEPDIPIYWIINYRYHTHFPLTVATAVGRNVGWTSWTHSRRRR